MWAKFSKALTHLIVGCALLVDSPIKAQYDYPMGCELDTISSELIITTTDMPSRGGMPARFSLKNWAPSVKRQKLPNCTSWATAYAAMTISKSIEVGKKVSPFSPLCLFNRYKVQHSRPHCDTRRGSAISTSLEILKEKGCELYSDHPTCRNESSYKLFKSKIFNYERLSIDIYTIKNRISKYQPVVIAFKSHRSSRTNRLASWANESNHMGGVWNGRSQSWLVSGGHAMCIVGYDDTKYGGAFEIMNSWGKEWGNQGFIWVRYDDFKKVCQEAYAVIPSTVSAKKINRNDGRMVIQPKRKKLIKPKPIPKPNPVIRKKERVKLSFGVYGEKVKFINSCRVPIYLAVSQNFGGDWNTLGWYKIGHNESKIIEISRRKINDFFWMASNIENKLYWHDRYLDNSNTFCLNLHEKFDFDNSKYSENMRSEQCNNQMGFIGISPPKGSVQIIQEIGCSELRSRGGGVELQPLIIESINNEEISSSDYYTAPMLFDKYTGHVIQPNLNGNYEFYLKESETIKKVSIPSTDWLKYRDKLIYSSKQNASYK